VDSFMKIFLKGPNMKSIFTVLAAVVLFFTPSVFADNNTDGEPSVVEKTTDGAKEVYEDTKKVTKKAYRKAKDKTCEMVNGKMECIAKKAKHSVQNAADEVKDKANDIKRN